MKSTTIKFTLFSLFLLLLSCKEELTDSKLRAYLDTLGIKQKESSITAIDPNYCGSCTQFTINWINAHQSKREHKFYYILSTDSIPPNLFKSLHADQFKILIVTPEKLKRLGYGGAVSYNFIFDKEGKMSEQIIKAR